MSERVEALWAMHATGHHLSRDAIEELFKAHDSARADARLLAAECVRLRSEANRLKAFPSRPDEATEAALARHSPAAEGNK